MPFKMSPSRVRYIKLPFQSFVILKMKCLWKQSENGKKQTKKPPTTSKKKKQPNKQKTMRKPNVLRLNVFMRHKYTKKKSPNI